MKTFSWILCYILLLIGVIYFQAKEKLENVGSVSAIIACADIRKKTLHFLYNNLYYEPYSN